MKKQTPKTAPKFNKKKIIMIISIVLLVAALAGIGVGIYAKHYHSLNHAEDLTGDELFEYNYVLTVFGRNKQVISSNDVLIVDTVTKNLGGDTEITFFIYRYTSESDLDAALRMSAEQIAADSRFEYMGTGTVSMIRDEIAGMSNMKTVYVK